MEAEDVKKILTEQEKTLSAASQVLQESYGRVQAILAKSKGSSPLSSAESESCEALTSRFARLRDLLVQRVFRTVDQIELVDEGSILDRLNRTEKREIIESAEKWKEFRELRNDIAHEYLIDSSDGVLKDAAAAAPDLFRAVEAWKKYIRSKKYI